MFNILGIERPVFNIPLESLSQKVEIKRVERGERVRKTVSDYEEEGKPAPRQPGYVERAYGEAALAEEEGRQLLYASEIMSSPVLTLSPSLSVAEGWRSFQKGGVRHMPVLSQEGQIIGIVSERDLLKKLNIQGSQLQGGNDATIADIMTRQVITADKETDIRRIARAMFESHIGTMPIVDNEKRLIGIITRSDILFALIHYGPLRLWA